MNQFVYLKNFLFLELNSLGFAYFLIQKFTFQSQIKVFEASPTPRGAILVLTSSSDEELKTVLMTIHENSDYQAQTENAFLSKDLPEKLIEAYLNQILAPLKSNLVLFESESICEAVKAASLAVENNIEICEFRTLRSAVYRCVVSLTTSLAQKDIENIFAVLTATKKIKLTYLESPTHELRHQYNLE